MYVIVEIAGQQFKAENGRKLYVHRLQGEENSSVSFDKVLLVDNDGQVKVGAPVVEGASVKCKILKHLKDDKVLVFKKILQFNRFWAIQCCPTGNGVCVCFQAVLF